MLATYPIAPRNQLSLATPADWAWWEADALAGPRWRAQIDAAAFWDGAPPLTAAQELAFRMGRPTAHVALSAMRRRATRFTDARYRGEFVQTRLYKYPRFWARSHTACIFRVVPPGRRPRAALAPTNPLRPLLDWATGEEVFEDRWVWAALPPGLRFGRPRYVADLLRSAERAGVVVRLGTACLSAVAWSPTRRATRRWHILPVLVPHAIEHQTVAVEVAATLAANRAPGLSARGVRSAAALARDVRGSRGRLARGTRLPATADARVVAGDGTVTTIEFLSENYRRERIAAKFHELGPDVEYVALNQVVARRALRDAPPSGASRVGYTV